MSIILNPNVPHRVVAANRHFYETPTEELYLNRVLRYHDFIYLVKGQWLFTEEDADYLLEKDDVLLLSAGHHHYTRLPCAAGTHTMCLHISNEEASPDPSFLTLPTLLHVKNMPAARRYFEEIVNMYWSEDPLKDAKMSALFQLLTLELSSQKSALPSTQASLAEQVIELVNSTPHHNFRLSDIGERFCVSPRTVENCMHKAVGTSFTRYQISRKLEMAAQQLRVEPDVTLSEIAQNFGFYDAFHMSKAFKAKYGVSPAQYRNSLKDPTHT